MALTKPRAYQIYDIDYKQAVRVVTVNNVTLSGGAPNTVDGVTLSLNDRVLVAGQTNNVQNGIYYVTTLGTGSNGTWSRSIDTDTTGELLSGTIVMVTEGTSYADTQWKLITDDPITIGVSSLVFTLNYGVPFTVAASPPATGNVVSAQWLNSNTGALYEYQYDGTSYYWVDITGPTVANTSSLTVSQIVNGTSNARIVSANSNITMSVNSTPNVVIVSSDGINVTGNILPTANAVYNLGSPTQQWSNLYLKGNTIYLGDATISSSGSSLSVGSGLVPSMSLYRTNANIVGLNSTAVQNFIGVGVTLSANTVYQFEGLLTMFKTAGTTSHSIAFGFGGTAGINNIHHAGAGSFASTSINDYDLSAIAYSSATNAIYTITSAQTTASLILSLLVRGTVSISTAGTFIPQYQLSAAPGGSYTVPAGSFFSIWPLGAAGGNISIGTWS